MKRKSTFNKLLKMHCKNNGMKLKDLARQLDVAPSYLGILGTKYGVSIHMVDDIIKLLKIKGDAAIVLRSSALYTNPRKPIKVDGKFLSKIEDQITLDGGKFSNIEMICAALKFVGVKFKAAKM